MKQGKLIMFLAFVLAVMPLFGIVQQVNASEAGNVDPNGDSNQAQDVDSMADLEALVEQLADEGEFGSDPAVHALKLHLTAVMHYEKEKKKDKVIKHMKGFKVLLAHQKENEQISEDAYNELKDHTDALIQWLQALPIVQNDQAQADILISLSASDQMEYAASEMQNAIQKISGAELSILKEDFEGDNEEGNEGNTRIILATPETYPELSNLFKDDFDYLGATDGFAVKQYGNQIYIFGPNSRGVLNGVYDFLEENTDILWTRAQESGTIYKKQSTIKATKVNYKEKSPFSFRGWIESGATKGRSKEGEKTNHYDFKTSQMQARNKNNIVPGDTSNLQYWEESNRIGLQHFFSGHNLRYWLPPDEYFDEHPEYYNWENGEYVPTGQLNFYNPDVPHIIADKVKQFHKDHDVNYIGVMQHDNSDFTESEKSKEPFTTPNGTVVQPDDPAYKSTVFFTFINKIAAEVAETYPDVKIVTYSYMWTEEPPKVDIEDNVVIEWATASGDMRIPLNTTDQSSNNYEYKQNLEKWASKTKNIFWRPYYGCCGDTPTYYERPIAETVQKNLQYIRDLGLLGVMPEGVVDHGSVADEWGMNALQYWLIFRLFWNPDADLEALKNEFIQKAYGDAAEPMRHYYDLIKQGWNDSEAPVNAIYTDASELVSQYIIHAGIQDEARNALDEAWDHAGDEEKARIEPIRSNFIEAVEKYGEPSGNLSAGAVKTTATKDEILESLDFSTGPWADSEPITTFYKHKTDEHIPDAINTKVYLLWDDENLYVGYENYDDDISNMRISDVENGYWKDGGSDHVETHVSTGNGGTTYAYFTNPEAAGFVYKSGPTSLPDVQFLQSADILDDRWNVIQVIPFSDIGLDPQETNELKALFFRGYHRSANYSWGGGKVWSPGDLSTVHLLEQ